MRKFNAVVLRVFNGLGFQNLTVGSWSDEEGSWIMFAVLPVGEWGYADDAELCAMLGWCETYAGVGQGYSNAPMIWRGKSRICVKWTGGWDI